MKYLALIAYGDDEFDKFQIDAFNDEDALKQAKCKAREMDGMILTVVQGKNFEKGRVVMS